MQQRRVRRLVVAGEQGELKGIITQNHLLQALDPKEMYGVIELLQRQEAGNYLMSRSVVIDIRERKQAEAALKQQIRREHLMTEITQSIHQTLDVEEV